MIIPMPAEYPDQLYTEIGLSLPHFTVSFNTFPMYCNSIPHEKKAFE